jgi:hypothetical protein
LLAARATNLVQLLRIKLEDDQDLDLAAKTLQTAVEFFEALARSSNELGDTTTHMTLLRLDAM